MQRGTPGAPMSPGSPRHGWDELGEVSPRRCCSLGQAGRVLFKFMVLFSGPRRLRGCLLPCPPSPLSPESAGCLRIQAVDFLALSLLGSHNRSHPWPQAYKCPVHHLTRPFSEHPHQVHVTTPVSQMKRWHLARASLAPHPATNQCRAGT